MIRGVAARAPLVPGAVLMLALLVPAAGFGQDGQAAAGRGARGPAVRPAELAAMLDAYAIVQAQSALRLTDAQHGQFVARLKRMQETRRRNTQSRNRLLQELRGLVTSATPDDTAIRDRLKALRDHDDQAAAALRREAEAVDEVLDARQQGLFRLFEERIERQKLDLLMLARNRARPAAERRPDGGR